ncbi:MAG TPA: type II toxin-antitoxin system prevent-host-death family antitoxin [Solirubrobacterales bacterium]|nr:type II toxin-antitoxin system prevent-host-death family antitoxin [Solirubrobacterales bacterium]
MREIGVRDLKATLSKILREVEDGEQVRITSHGRPIADLVPAGSRRADEQMRKLVAEGKVTPASRPFPPNAPAPRRTGKSATAFVLAEREAER